MAWYFNEEYYVKAKLAQLAAVGEKDSAGAPYTLTSLRQAIADAGMTPEQHYLSHGCIEGLNPNAYFNEVEYLIAKTNQVNSIAQDGRTNWTVDEVKAAMADIGLTPAEHYEVFGGHETKADGTLINPSNAFDTNAYLAAKLAELQKTEPEKWASATPSDVLKAITEAGMSPVTHYMQFGATEANVSGLALVQTVPVSQRVTNDTHRDAFNDNVPGNYNPATPGPESNTAHVVTKPADVGGLANNSVSPTVTKPADPLAVPGNSGYVAPPANIVDTNDNPVVIVPGPSGRPSFGIVADDGKTVNGVDAGGKPTTEVIGTVGEGGTVTPVTPVTPDPVEPTPPAPVDPNALTTSIDRLEGKAEDDVFTGTWVDGKVDQGTLQATEEDLDIIDGKGNKGTLKIDMSGATSGDMSNVYADAEGGNYLSLDKVVLDNIKTLTTGLDITNMACDVTVNGGIITNSNTEDENTLGLKARSATSLTLNSTNITGGKANGVNAGVGAGVSTNQATKISLSDTTLTGGDNGGVALYVGGGTNADGKAVTLTTSGTTTLTGTGGGGAFRGAGLYAAYATVFTLNASGTTKFQGGTASGTQAGSGLYTENATTVTLTAETWSTKLIGGEGTGNGGNGGYGLYAPKATEISLKGALTLTGGAVTDEGSSGGEGLYAGAATTIRLDADGAALTLQGGAGTSGGNGLSASASNSVDITLNSVSIIGGNGGNGGNGLSASATTLNLTTSGTTTLQGGTGNGMPGFGLDAGQAGMLKLDVQSGSLTITGGTSTSGGVGINNAENATVTVTITGAGNVTIDGGTANGTQAAGFAHAVKVAASELTGKLTLSGSGENDTITGGKGQDIITGGAGNDTFVFNKGSSKIDEGKSVDSYDTITDFTKIEGNTDKLQLVDLAAGSDQNFKAAENAVQDFAAAKAAADKLLTNDVIYAFVTDGTDGYLFVDNNETDGADEVILLTGMNTVSSLTYSDITAIATTAA